MNQQNKSFQINPKSLIACVLLAISFIMLLTPWIKFSVKVSGKDYTIKRIIAAVAAEEGESEPEFRREMQEDVRDSLEDLRDYGINVNEKRAMRLLDAFYKGKISVFNVVMADLSLIRPLLQLRSVVQDNPYGYFISDTLEQISRSSIAAVIGAIVLFLLFVAAVVLFLLGLYGTLTGKKHRILPYAIIISILFVIFAITVIAGNRVFENFAYFLDDLEDILYEIGAYDDFSSSNKLFHLRLAPFAAILFAWLAFVVMQMKDSASAPKFAGVSGTPASVPADVWDCPACGARANGRFCPNCGTKRPEARFCSNCGAKLVDGQLFCGECGFPVSK